MTTIRTRCAERRVAERPAPLELLGEEALDVVARRVRDRPRVGLERLHEHTPRRVAAAAAGELGDQLERALLGAEVGHREAGVGVDDRGELDACEVVPLRHHLRPEQHGGLGVAEAPQRGGQLLGLRDRIRVEPDQLELGQLALELAFELLRPGAEAREVGRPQTGQLDGAGSPWPQWWQRKRPSPCSTSATSQFGQRIVVPHARQWSAGAIPRRFSSRIALPRFSATTRSAERSGAESG